MEPVQMWHLLNVEISVFEHYKLQQRTTEHLQLFYTIQSLFQVKICNRIVISFCPFAYDFSL